jgi:putative membrane protein
MMNTENQEENLILRDCLALERTNQANERTFLAYARTAVMALFTGISLFRLFPESMAIYIFGWAAILTSFILFFWGLKKYVSRFRSISALQSKCSTFMNKNSQ